MSNSMIAFQLLGVIALVQSSPTIAWHTSPIMFALPEVEIGATYVEHAEFVGTLFDVPTPMVTDAINFFTCLIIRCCVIQCLVVFLYV